MQSQLLRRGRPRPAAPTGARLIWRDLGDGWRRIDRGGPFSRFLAGLTAILLAVPILVIGLVLLLALTAFGIAAALVSLVIGRRPGQRKAAAPTEPGRENVRVIPPRS